LFINQFPLLKTKLTYYFSLLLILILSSCGQYKSLQKSQFLLRSNKLEIEGEKTLKEDLKSFIRQKPNKRLLGIPYGILIYQSIDSIKIANKREIHIKKLRNKNLRLYENQAKINKKRNEKAIRKNKPDYKFKKVVPHDTINIRLSIREWLKFRFGEKPVVFDSIEFNKTLEQFSIFLKKKGFYDAKFQGVNVFNKKKQKVETTYFVNTGGVYLIESLSVNTTNHVLKKIFFDFNAIEKELIDKGAVFDSEKLNSYRDKLSKFMRDNGIFGMNSSNIQFIADSNKRDRKINLSLEFTQRLYKNQLNEKIEKINHKLMKVKNVYFHVIDTSSVPYNFKKKVISLGRNLTTNGFVTTIDTVIFKNNLGLKFEKFRKNLTEISDSLKKTRTIILTFNHSYWLRPYALEDANILQANTYYSEYNFDRTVLNLNDLGVFQLIKPEIVDLGDEIEVHYYLVPKKKLIYNLKPIIKTSGVFLGVSGIANFTNINLFKGSEKVVLGFTGGFQSMPNPKYTNSIGDVNDNVSEAFNTFEIGPSIKLELPGLFPISRSFLQKTQKSKTLLQSSYGFQKRNVFTLQTFRLNYIYNFSVGENNEFQFGFPGFSSINFVNYIDFDENFKASIYSKNDPFTQNYYRSQLNWQDLKFVYQYNTLKNKNDVNSLIFKSSFDLAGNLISIFSIAGKDVFNNQRTLFGIPYSQFIKLDNEFVFAHKISKETSIHSRFLAGIGVPYTNSKFSLPFDYSFLGGGPNDMRAWRAGTLGPGSYNYYLDSNFSTMQLGDIRIGFSSEYRFKISKILKGALFVDAGNIWTTKNDVNRPGAQFTNNWYKEIAIASGFGIRADFDFLVVRVDCGFKLRNPALSENYRWFFDKKDEAVHKVIEENTNTFVSPFLPRNLNDIFNSLRLGIGYPF
jgi:outer membrane protein insertion porin family